MGKGKDEMSKTSKATNLPGDEKTRPTSDTQGPGKPRKKCRRKKRGKNNATGIQKSNNGAKSNGSVDDYLMMSLKRDMLQTEVELEKVKLEHKKFDLEASRWIAGFRREENRFYTTPAPGYPLHASVNYGIPSTHPSLIQHDHYVHNTPSRGYSSSNQPSPSPFAITSRTPGRQDTNIPSSI